MRERERERATHTCIRGCGPVVASCVGGPLPVLTWEWSAVVLSIRDNRFGTLCKRRQWIKSGKLLVGTGWSIHALHWGILRVTAAVVQLKQLFSKIFINEMIKDTVIKTYYHLKCWHNRKKTRSSISRRSPVVHPTQVHNLAWNVEIELQRELWWKMKSLCILQMNKVSKLKTKSKKHNTKPRKNSVPIVE